MLASMQGNDKVVQAVGCTAKSIAINVPTIGEVAKQK